MNLKECGVRLPLPRKNDHPLPPKYSMLVIEFARTDEETVEPGSATNPSDIREIFSGLHNREIKSVKLL